MQWKFSKINRIILLKVKVKPLELIFINNRMIFQVNSSLSNSNSNLMISDHNSTNHQEAMIIHLHTNSHKCNNHTFSSTNTPHQIITNLSNKWKIIFRVSYLVLNMIWTFNRSSLNNSYKI